MKRLSPLLGFTALLITSMISFSASAEDPEDLLGLLNESIVTTASQSAETASTAPAQSTTISAGDLRRYGIHTVEEAINFLSLGVSSGGGRSLNSTVDMGARGVLLPGDSGNHFLVLIDGHAVNEPFFGTARFDHTAGITLESVDRIEVIVGPGSILYGSNAMLGVINIITKSAESLRGGHVVAETQLPVFRRVAALAGAPFRVFGTKAEMTAAFQYWEEYGPNFTLGPQNLGLDVVSERPARTRRGGPEDGIWGGLADQSSYARVPSGMVKLRMGDFELAIRGRIASWGRPFGVSDFDDPGSSVVERSASADLKYSTLLTPELGITARIYADTFDNDDRSHFSRSASCPFPGVTTCQYQRLAASRWAGLHLQANYSWLPDGSLNSLLGFDGRTRFAGSKQDLLDFDTRRHLVSSQGVVDESDQTFGAYFQQVWVPTLGIGLNAGARLDHDPRFDPVVSPRAAANVEPWHNGRLRAIYSQAFRAPSFDETNFGNLSRALPDSLSPETVRSVEGSIEQRFGTHRILFGVFRTWWTDLVQLRNLTFEQALEATNRGQLPLAVPNTDYTQFQNATSVSSYGLNAALEGSFSSGRVLYGLNVTEAHSRSEGPSGGSSQLLPVAPQFFGNARLAYDLGATLPTLGVAGFLLSSRPADRAFTNQFNPTPFAPTHVNLRATATGKAPLVKGLSYRLTCDYLIGNQGPYVIGPVLVATAENPSAELSPLPTFRASFGLQYDFLN